MEEVRRQNAEIKRMIEHCMEEIEKQKQLNAQHETEIQTLLKFNQRLLGIIENELNNPRKERISLQPISERSERQSDLATPPLHSFIRARRLAPKSERGSGTSNSLIERASFAGGRLENIGREVMKSQLNHSSHEEHSEYVQQDSLVRSIEGGQLQEAISKMSRVRGEMRSEKQEFQRYNEATKQFYTDKIGEIRSLAKKISSYHPADHLKQINQKLNISPATASLMNKILNSN